MYFFLGIIATILLVISYVLHLSGDVIVAILFYGGIIGVIVYLLARSVMRGL